MSQYGGRATGALIITIFAAGAALQVVWLGVIGWAAWSMVIQPITRTCAAVLS